MFQNYFGLSLVWILLDLYARLITVALMKEVIH